MAAGAIVSKPWRWLPSVRRITRKTPTSWLASEICTSRRREGPARTGCAFAHETGKGAGPDREGAKDGRGEESGCGAHR